MNFLTEHLWYGNPLSEWLISLCILLVTLLLGRVMIWLGNGPLQRRVEKTDTLFDDFLLHVFKKPAVCGVILIGMWIAAGRLSFPEGVSQTLGRAFRVLAILDVTWIVTRFVNNLLASVLERHKSAIQKNEYVIRSVQKFISVVMWLIGGISALDSMGVSISALLTTLGIGGVAVALAAQDTVKNLFGGVTMMTDGPFRLGDRIVVGAFEGYVEDIGFRSTRLRSLDGRQVTIPNYKLVDSEVTNVSREPRRRVLQVLGLTYSTTPAKMEEAMTLLRSLPDELPVMGRDVVAAFTGYGDFAMEITFIYYIEDPLHNDVYQATSAVNMAVLRKFAAAGLDFAFPTQTIYLEKNG